MLSNESVKTTGLDGKNMASAGLRTELFDHYRELVPRLVRRFLGKGESYEDLMQVGYLGLLKAIDRFDPEQGNSFVAYATPTIQGELKRYFRDRAWRLKISRRNKERALQVKDFIDRYMRTNGHKPSSDVIGTEMNLTQEEVSDALQILENFYTLSLDAPISSDPETDDLGSLYGEYDAGFDSIIDRQTLDLAMQELPERQQEILRLRYYEIMPQRQVASLLGISQMHVSRLERQALDKLRKIL
ncbi:MAG TPA: sigma-70 family RNA polymerase sigma factor [Bacillota bacterium]|jgi:RNA polymerase sigma-B factor|nr:sigma-70 family RNA polymerase sigma factor [Bacillota bacterium]NLU54879.1 sigma-70 family RNA polymerase sigma factor [Bacillota bacterium]HOA92037.1 sigma-70 family RNA polymerase sigma factor [Bacillota bacterium]HOL14471.1 sigma-70 family RNA polymerase sigma factor [Bacillota bacterium]HOP54665.1 sigma-70 family RNA polymerase sigma factor [Bacillota bacterium]